MEKTEYQRRYIEKLKRDGRYEEYLQKVREYRKKKYKEDKEFRQKTLDRNRQWRQDNKKKWSKIVYNCRKKKQLGS